jgi:hypothetical protein
MKQKELHVFMPIDVIKSASKDDGGAWVFEGIASTADVDLFGEVVYPDSFNQSIEFFKSKGKIYFDHDYAKTNEDWLKNHGFSKDEILSLKTPIGKPTEARITDEGLYIKGILNKEHPMARKMWTEFLNNSDSEFHNQIGLSIGAKYMGQPRREYDVKKGKYITYLPELLLYEVSMTPEPVNPFTRTWASVIKSMSASEESETQYHTIVPESVLFDEENGRLVVKSVVESEDGVTHVFESYINVKEDVTKAMAKEEKVILKAAFPPGKEEEEQEGPPPSSDGPEEVEDGPPQDGPPMGGAPEMGGAPGMEGGMPPMMGGEEGAGGILDGLVGQEDPGMESPLGGDNDAGLQMLLDKVDTLIDLVMQMSDGQQSMGLEDSLPMEGQVETQPPLMGDSAMKSIRDSLSDITVQLSDESTALFGEAIKSILVAGFVDMEDRIAAKVVEKLSNESTVTTKSVTYSKESPKIVNPGASVSGKDSEPVQGNVLKAIMDDGDEVQVNVDVLKSFVGKYREVIGYTASHAQKRARVIEEATKALGIPEDNFKNYVRQSEKGRL